MSGLIERLLIAVGAALVLAVLVFVYHQWRDCTDSGGVMVRGLLGYECLAKGSAVRPSQ